MSRQRITAKVRTNADYQAYASFLDGIGLRFSVHKPTGKGHPFLLIEHPSGGEPLRFTIACTPRGKGSVERKVSHLKRELRKGGIIP